MPIDTKKVDELVAELKKARSSQNQTKSSQVDPSILNILKSIQDPANPFTEDTSKYDDIEKQNILNRQKNLLSGKEDIINNPFTTNKPAQPTTLLGMFGKPNVVSEPAPTSPYTSYEGVTPGYHVKDERSWLGNTVAAIPYGGINLANSFKEVADASGVLLGKAVEKAGNVANKVAALTGNAPKQTNFLQELGKGVQNKWQDYVDADEANAKSNAVAKLVGYNPAPVQEYGVKFKDNVKSGNFTQVAKDLIDPAAVTAGAESLIPTIAMLFPTGFAATTTANLNSDMYNLRKSAKENNIQLDPYTVLEKGAASVVGSYLDKLGAESVLGKGLIKPKYTQPLTQFIDTLTPEIKNEIVKQYGKRLLNIGIPIGKIIGNGLIEGATEGAQTILQNKASDATKDFTHLSPEEIDQALTSTGIGIGAGASMHAASHPHEVAQPIAQTLGMALDTANLGINKAVETTSGKTTTEMKQDINDRKVSEETNRNNISTLISNTIIPITEDMSEEQQQHATYLNNELNTLHENALNNNSPLQNVQTAVDNINKAKEQLGFKVTTPENTSLTSENTSNLSTPTEELSNTANTDNNNNNNNNNNNMDTLSKSKVTYDDSEASTTAQRAGIANVLTTSDKVNDIRVESDADTRTANASTKKNKVMSVFSANDDVIQDVLDGKMDTEYASNMTNSNDNTILNFAKRLGKKLGISTSADTVATLRNMNDQITNTLQTSKAANIALNNLYAQPTTQKALKIIAMTIDAVHSAMRSEHDISKMHGLSTKEVSEARRQEVAHQLGKEFMNSHELRLVGEPTETAKAYIEIGENMLKLASEAGYIESDRNSDVAIHNIHDMEGNRISNNNVDTYYNKGSKKGTINVPTVKVSNIQSNARGAHTAITKAANSLNKLFKPVNYELPTKEATTEVPTESPISKEHKAIIQAYNKLQYSIKPEALKILKEIKEYINTAYNGDIDNALASDPLLKNILGLQKSDATLREDTEGGKAIGRKKTIIDLLDNLEEIEQGDLHFNYESAINQRIHVMQTVLDFQGDKYMARQILQGGSKETTVTSKLGKELLINNVAEELGWSKEEVKNPTNKAVNNFIKILNDTGTIPFKELVNLQKILKTKSPFKALSLLKAIADISNAKDGVIKTNYQVENDATASGVVNTLLNLSGHTKVQSILKLLGIGTTTKGTDPYKFIASVLENSPAYEHTLKPILDKLNDVGLNARDIAKYPIMKWFYGQLDSNNNKEMGNSIADELIDLGLYSYNNKAISLINEILGVNKYTIDNIDTKNSQIPITEITNEDRNTIAMYYTKTIAKEYTDALNTQFAEVIGYRNKMNTIYKLLNNSGKWNGTIRTAIDALLGSTKQYKMSVKKLKQIVFKTNNDETYTTNKMMNNETSFNVNLQHNTDAALLLMSIKDVVGDLIDSGMMTVHDALYADPEVSLKIIDRYNYYTKEAAIKYDYMDVALAELNDIINKMDNGALKDSYIKQYNEMKTENDIVKKAKEEYLADKELNILGDWEVGNKLANERSASTETSTANSTNTQTVEETNANTYASVKNILNVIKLYASQNINGAMSEKIALELNKLHISPSHKALLEKVLNAFSKEGRIKLVTDTSLNKANKAKPGDAHYAESWSGLDNIVTMPNNVAMIITDKTGSKIFDLNDPNTLVEVLAHEIDHAVQYSYIVENMHKSNELKYMQKVVEKLQKILNNGTQLSALAKSRLSYALSPEFDIARKVSELSSILSNELNVRDEILNSLNTNPTIVEKIKTMIAKIMQNVREFFSNMTDKEIEDLDINSEYVKAAIEAIDSNARVNAASATTEIKPANITATKDNNKDIPLNPLTAMNDAIAASNRFTADWLIIFADTIEQAVSPHALKAHTELKRVSPLYRQGISLLKTGFYDSEFAQKMHYVLGLAGDVSNKLIKTSLSLFDTYQKESATLREAMAELDRKISDKYSKEDRIVLHQLFADTGIANILSMPEIKIALFNGSKSISQLIEEVKSKIPADKIHLLDNVANEWVTGTSTKTLTNVAQTGITSNEAYVYTTLKAIESIPKASKILSSMDTSLREWMMSLALLNKQLSNEINQMQQDSEGVSYSSSKTYYSKYDGSYSMDVHDTVHDYELLTAAEMRHSKYSSENGWVVIREPKGNARGLVARVSYEGRVAGVGLNANRYINGVFLSAEQSKSITNTISSMTEEQKTNWLNENKLIEDGTRYRILIPKSVKIEKLGMMQNAAHSLYRTYIHNKELIESESIRKLMLDNGTTVIKNKAGLRRLEQTLKENDIKGVRGKKGIREEVNPFISIDFKVEELSDYTSFEALKKEFPMIAKYYKTAEGLSSINNFNKQINYVKRGVSDVLLGHNTFSIFNNNDNRSLAKWEDTFKKMIVMIKQKQVVTNPKKLMNDTISNIGILSIMDVGLVEIMEGFKKGFKDYKEYAAEHSKYVTFAMEAKLAQALNSMEPTPENNAKAIAAIKKRDSQQAKLEKLEFHDAFKEGFMQSYSTNLITKEFDSITGLQKDIDAFIDKYTHNEKGDPNALFKAIKWWQHFGIGMSDVTRAAAKLAKENKTDLGSELLNLSKRLENKKNDKESVSRYLSDIIGAPSSEIINYGSAYMVLVDALSKKILADHLQTQLNPRTPRNARRKYTKEEAYNLANDVFVDYRSNLPSEIKALSDYGILMYPEFWIKFQRTIGTMLKYHPVTSSISYATSVLSGTETLNALSQALPIKASTTEIVHNPVSTIIDNPWSLGFAFGGV